MNMKNLMMWGLIVLLVVGLFQLFQNPKKANITNNTSFSSFLQNVDDGNDASMTLNDPIKIIKARIV